MPVSRAHRTVGPARPRTLVAVTSAAALFALAGSAIAQPIAGLQWGRYGSNTQLLSDPQYGFGGTFFGFNLPLAGISRNLGQVEGGRPGDADVMTGAGVSEVFHPAVNPGGAGTVGVYNFLPGPPRSAPAVGAAGANLYAGSLFYVVPNTVPPPAQATFNVGPSLESDHPTQVASVMVANGSITGLPANTQRLTGVAPFARLHSGNFLNYVSGTRQPNNSVQLNTAPFDQGAVVATEAVRAQNVDAINMSFGLFPPANNTPLDGNSLLSHYTDWAVSQQNQVIVVAGNEDPDAFRPNLTQKRIFPNDAFNQICVGVTTQRGAGGELARFDQIANFSSPNTSLSDRTDGPFPPGDPRGLARVNVDLVAPGGASITATIRNTVTMATRPWDDFSSSVSPLGPNEVFVPDAAGNIAFAKNGTSDVYMATLVDPTPVGGPQATLAAPAFTSAGGTSFSAPQVTAAVGLMQEFRAAQGRQPLSHLSVKAALMNSASKHVLRMNLSSTGNGTSDVAGTAWPVFQANNMGNADPLNMRSTIDDQIGTGQLNGVGVIRQIAPNSGNQRLSVGSDVLGPDGETLYNVGAGAMTRGSLVTATLVWDRKVTNPNAAANFGDLVNNAQYNATQLADLDLFLINNDTGDTVAASRSYVNNKEHLYFNVPTDGSYSLKIKNFANQTVDFAVAQAGASSSGMTFVVPNKALGVQAGFNNTPFPNDVNALGEAGQGHYETSAELFSSDLSGTNQQRLSGGLGTLSPVGPHIGAPAAMNLLTGQSGVLGLRSGDQITGLSFGHDGTRNPQTGAAERSTLTFSVDKFANGTALTGVQFEATMSPPGGVPTLPLPSNPGGGAPGQEAAGDVFKSAVMDPFGKYSAASLVPAAPFRNDKHIDEQQLGLQAPNGRGSIGANAPDNLGDFDHDNILDYADADGDGRHNAAVFFSLGRFSPTLPILAGLGASTADVFVSPMAGVLNLYANALQIGLIPAQPGSLGGDGIDALIISDVNVLGFAEPTVDEMLFSLTPGSLSGRPGDVYYTDFARIFNPLLSWTLGGSLYASAESLGLMGNDNIDGLDIFVVPVPGAGVLLGLAGFAALRRRRA